MAGGGRLVVLGVLDVQADPGLRSELPERVVTDSYGDGARLVFGLDDGTLCELPRQAVEEWAAGDGRWNRVLETVIEVDTFRQAYDALTPGGARDQMTNQLQAGVEAVLLAGLQQVADGGLVTRGDGRDDPVLRFVVSGVEGFVIVSDWDGLTVGRFTFVVDGRFPASVELFQWVAEHATFPTFGTLSVWERDDDAGTVGLRVSCRLPLALMDSDDVAGVVHSLADAALDVAVEVLKLGGAPAAVAQEGGGGVDLLPATFRSIEVALNRRTAGLGLVDAADLVDDLAVLLSRAAHSEVDRRAPDVPHRLAERVQRGPEGRGARLHAAARMAGAASDIARSVAEERHERHGWWHLTEELLSVDPALAVLREPLLDGGEEPSWGGPAVAVVRDAITAQGTGDAASTLCLVTRLQQLEMRSGRFWGDRLSDLPVGSAFGEVAPDLWTLQVRVALDLGFANWGETDEPPTPPAKVLIEGLLAGRRDSDLYEALQWADRSPSIELVDFVNSVVARYQHALLVDPETFQSLVPARRTMPDVEAPWGEEVRTGTMGCWTTSELRVLFGAGLRQGTGVFVDADVSRPGGARAAIDGHRRLTAAGLSVQIVNAFAMSGRLDREGIPWFTT